MTLCTHYIHVHVYMQWLEKDFLQYLADWKASVESRPGFTRGEKALMCLSKETIEGLHITGKIAYAIIALVW